MTYRELTRKLRRLGCTWERQAGGSHEIWVNPANDRETTIPRHASRDLPVGTVHGIRRDLGITRQEVDNSSSKETTMPHMLGDHNRAIVELYLAEFDTEEGPLILECWSMEPIDAAMAFRKFFANDHPDRKQLSDNSRLKEHEAFSNEWNEIRDWWRSQTVWSGEHIEMAINPGTRLTIGETVIEYNKSSYLTWSRAYPSTKDQIVESTYLSSRDQATPD